jgi:hypothetical protein
VLAAHKPALAGYAAPDALHRAVPVDVLLGRGLQAPVAIGRLAAENAALLVMVMLMKPVQAFGTAVAVFCTAAKNTSSCHNFPLYDEFVFIIGR